MQTAVTHSEDLRTARWKNLLRRRLGNRRGIDVLVSERVDGDVAIVRPDRMGARGIRGNAVVVAEECGPAARDSEVWIERRVGYPDVREEGESIIIRLRIIDVEQLPLWIVPAVVERDIHSTAERRDRREDLVICRDVVHAGWRRPAYAVVRRPAEQDIRISGSVVRPRHEDGAGSLADGHPREAVEAVDAPRERLRDRDNRRDPLLRVERLAAVEGPGEQDLVFVEILPSDVHLPSGADGDRRALVLRVRGMAEREDRGPAQAPVRGALEHDLRAVAPLEEGPRNVHVPVTGAARVVDRDPLFVGNT